MEEEKEFKKLYQRYRTRLLYFILRKVEKLEDAEEILQDTFISALDSLPLFRKQSSFYTWLCAIAKHEMADFYRKKKLKTIVFSRFPQLEKIVSQALSPEAALEAKELEEEVVQCLKGLSEGYARILRLKYIDGLSYRQIAKKLKKPVKAIESKLSRARKAFAKNWQTHPYAPEISSFNDS
jgi:RNA polymerase sigma-70 factor (ECF subfamily)